jgi:glucokinase
MMIGVHLDYGEVRTALTNPAAHLLDGWDEPIEISPDPAPALAAVRRQIAAARQAAAQRGANVLGVGAVVGGLLDDAGVLVHSMYLGWRNIQLRDAIQAMTELPVFVERGTNAALLAEQYYGAARNARLVAYLRLSSRGVGAAVLVGGELLAGARHLGGELGHMIVEPDGPHCVCGSWGCLEAVCSEDALLRHAIRLTVQREPQRARRRLPDSPDAVLAAARGGDAACLEALRQTGTYLGIGLSNLINILNPDLVLVGGAPFLEEPATWQAMERQVARRTIPEALATCRVDRPALGEAGVRLGAAALALRALVRHPGLAAR